MGLSVPDYVFGTGYPRLGIGELKEYIEEHQHLPGLPDINDREGWASLSLQQREMKILEKVEENVLYIFDLQDELGIMNQELGGMKQELGIMNQELGEIRVGMGELEAKSSKLEFRFQRSEFRIS